MWGFIGVAVFLLGVPAMIVFPAFLPLICSVLSLVWIIFLTVWIKKIKDRQTETVLVQTMSLQVLQGIPDEIKKQNV
jgi:hypothetical protein